MRAIHLCVDILTLPPSLSHVLWPSLSLPVLLLVRHVVSRILPWQAATRAQERFDPDGLGSAVARFFQASTFLKFERDAAGAISLPLFLQYVARRIQCSKLVSA